MTAALPLLQAEGLHKHYGSFAALSDATFSINEGEVLGLIGPNGSGKTTLFECLAGVQPLSGGTVTARGRPIPSDDRKELLYYVPDGVRPWPDQRVGWAVDFIAGLSDTGDGARNDIVRALALESLLGARLGSLSKGEHKRVLVALGLLTSQSLLLLDEPFDGLDVRQTRDTMRVLRARAGAPGAHRRTLFLSIHQLSDAARVCDRLLLLSDGRIVGQGTLDELRENAGVHDASLEEIFLALT